MTAATFPHLFQPLRVGSVTIKNRILSTGHDTSMARDGTVSEVLVAYHRARAEVTVPGLPCSITMAMAGSTCIC